jgi:hypothetical protein
MRGTTLDTAVNPSVRTSSLTPGTLPSVEDLVTALLHNVPFLAPVPVVATDAESAAWLAAAGWPMTPRTGATDGVW